MSLVRLGALGVGSFFCIAVLWGAVQPREATLLRLRGAQLVPGGPALAVTLNTPLGTLELTTA